MKKIVLMSLLGLCAAHQSSAMFARAVRTASKVAAVTAAGVSGGVVALHAMPFPAILSQEEAQQLYEKYTEWAKENNGLHRKTTDEIRARELVDFQKALHALRLKSNPDFVAVDEKKRDCTEEEKNICKQVLLKAGYSEAEATQRTNNIYILKDEVNASGSYSEFTDTISLKESVIEGLKTFNKTSIQQFLHEVEHYNFCMGHCIYRDEYYWLLEEMRAEVESLRKVASLFGTESIKEPLFDNDIRSKFLLLIPYYKEQYRKLYIDEGYISCCSNMRKLVAAQIEKQESERA